MSESEAKQAKKKGWSYDLTSKTTSALIGLGVAYITWASGHILSEFKETTKELKTTTREHGNILQRLGTNLERVATALEADEKVLHSLSEGQREIRDKVIRLEAQAEKSSR